MGVSCGHGLVAVVQPGLRLHPEERGLGAGVTGVGTDDGEALQQGPGERAAAQGPLGRLDGTIQPAVALVIEAAIPGQRQAHLEGDGVVTPVAALAWVHPAFDQAVRWNRGAAQHQGAGGLGRCGVDSRLLETELRGQRRALLQTGAGGRFHRRWRCGLAARCRRPGLRWLQRGPGLASRVTQLGCAETWGLSSGGLEWSLARLRPRPSCAPHPGRCRSRAGRWPVPRPGRSARPRPSPARSRGRRSPARRARSARPAGW